MLSEEKFYTYILFSHKDKGFYIGYSTDLKKRLSEHARGEVTSTKDRRPIKLIHYEYFISKQDAKTREKFLKSGFGRSQMKKMLGRTMRQIL